MSENFFMSTLSIVLASKNSARLTKEQAVEIFELQKDIEALKEFGITTKNYTSKRNAYFKFAKKAYEEYAIELDGFPFKHPTKLNVQIYNIMVQNGLNESQINKLYKELDLTKPDKNDIENHTSKLFKIYREYENSDDDLDDITEDVDTQILQEYKQHEEYIKEQKHIQKNKFKRVLISPIE